MSFFSHELCDELQYVYCFQLTAFIELYFIYNITVFICLITGTTIPLSLLPVNGNILILLHLT